MPSSKARTLATSDDRLAAMLSQKICPKDHEHVYLKRGNATETSTYYPTAICEGIMAMLFTEQFHRNVPHLPRVPVCQGHVHA